MLPRVAKESTLPWELRHIPTANSNGLVRKPAVRTPVYPRLRLCLTPHDQSQALYASASQLSGMGGRRGRQQRPQLKPREWKHKPVAASPPGSPSATPDAAVASSATPDEGHGTIKVGGMPHGARKVGGMSASDAKESIEMGGSLTVRIAALKGMGACGAPPAEPPPRPSGDKPKWKPPPKVAHAPAVGDSDKDAGEVKLTFLSLAPVSAEGSLKSPPAVEVGDPMSAATEEEAEEKEQDPEEEERQ